MNGINVTYGRLQNGIYMLSWLVSVVYTSCKHPRIDNVSDAYLWHCRLGHINKNRINRLKSEGLLKFSECDSLLTYESYLPGKMTKSSFTEKGE